MMLFSSKAVHAVPLVRSSRTTHAGASPSVQQEAAQCARTRPTSGLDSMQTRTHVAAGCMRAVSMHRRIPQLPSLLLLLLLLTLQPGHCACQFGHLPRSSLR